MKKNEKWKKDIISLIRNFMVLEYIYRFLYFGFLDIVFSLEMCKYLFVLNLN